MKRKKSDRTGRCRITLRRRAQEQRVRKDIIRKSGRNRLTGNQIRVKTVKYIRKAIMLSAGVICAGLLFVGARADAAEETGKFRSKGAIHYTDSTGQEVILDAQDIQVLFQYAAEGKRGLSRALGGVGTKLTGGGQSYDYTRNPETGAVVDSLQTVSELQAVSFQLLLQALAESQKLPAGYEESWTLACSDNMTLGRAAWSDGSLARGNNRDLMEHYIRGWLEGSGCTDYEMIYDEEGRWIGYREKQI